MQWIQDGGVIYEQALNDSFLIISRLVQLSSKNTAQYGRIPTNPEKKGGGKVIPQLSKAALRSASKSPFLSQRFPLLPCP